MLENIKTFTAGGKEHEFAFTFNTLETIQDTYGTTNKWMAALYPETDLYPNTKEFKKALKLVMDEAIKIKNYHDDANRELTSLEEIDKLIAFGSQAEIIVAFNSAVASFFNMLNKEDDDEEDDEKK